MPVSWLAFLMVGLGGALGAIARYSVTLMLQRGAGSVPFGTLVSNLLGCLIIGVLAKLTATSDWFNAEGLFPGHYWLLFAVGFCGSFTTLSALVFEISQMLGNNSLAASATYLAVTFFGGLGLFYLGFALTRG